MSLESFTNAYIVAALWSSMDNSDENTGGDPLRPELRQVGHRARNARDHAKRLCGVLCRAW